MHFLETNGHSAHSPAELRVEMSHPDWQTLLAAYRRAQEPFADPIIHFTSRVSEILEEMKQYLKPRG